MKFSQLQKKFLKDFKEWVEDWKVFFTEMSGIPVCTMALTIGILELIG